MSKTREIELEFQPTIPRPPESPQELYKRACSSDEITVNHWRDTWLKQVAENHKRFGPFSKNGLGKLHNSLLHKPCIVVGAGPSLKYNVDDLRDTKGIAVISCLHNYHYLEDRGIKPNYYVTLDSGSVCLEEVAEGGEKTAEEYWASTKDKKLIAFTGTHPELIEKWQGEVIWFMAPLPDPKLMEQMAAIEPFFTYVSNGGNVLGACFYIAKAVMGANPIVFVGADFSFGYNKRFHSWESKYDKNMGHVQRATDIFGNSVKTWQSYYQFKCWFDSRACTVPGLYINATEGGILGAYPNGNIEQIKQMALADVIGMYSLSESMRAQCEKPEIDEKKILF